MEGLILPFFFLLKGKDSGSKSAIPKSKGYNVVDCGFREYTK